VLGRGASEQSIVVGGNANVAVYHWCIARTAFRRLRRHGADPKPAWL